jgi:UDP-N-acetylmuramyl pentapeptide phosphotransferase/UDP-N-acetylglucosamine-1-phosphate transferase/dTDP-4-dehydrorhamnose reductase
MNSVAWIVIAAAGIVSLIAPAAVKPLLKRLHVVDVPNERSSHREVTLRGGGLAQLTGVLVGLAGVFVIPNAAVAEVRCVAIVLGGALAASLIGLADDMRAGRGLGVGVRAGLQLVIGGAIAVALSLDGGNPLWLAIPAAILFAGYVNAANFMDGINGISGLHGLIVGVTYAMVGLQLELPWLAFVGLLIACCYTAFLPWNLIPPGLFLGDVGSYLLGAVIAAAGLAAWLQGVPVVAVAAPLSLYVADVVTTVVRRCYRNEPVLRAHHTHSYQRLIASGLSHVRVSLIVSALTAAAGCAGVLGAVGWLPTFVAWPVIIGVAALYVTLPRIRGHRLPPPPNAPLDSVPCPDSYPARPAFAPSRWAVIGATGFIGSSVTEYLRQQGLDVRALAAPRLTLDPASHSGDDVLAEAQGHPAAVELAKQLMNCDMVVNAAGMATPDASPTQELYGADALLPAVIAQAAVAAAVPRVIHLSSAAVQGRKALLDETSEVHPFSPYSRAKALGECGLLRMAADEQLRENTDLIIVRATSVQGPNRPTTRSLKRVAMSPLSSVASPGTQPTVVSSVDGLTRFIHQVGVRQGVVSPILLQPWEGLSVREVLKGASGKEPHVLPRRACLVLLTCGRAVGRVIPELAGLVRRVELMWLGQEQVKASPWDGASQSSSRLVSILRQAGEPVDADADQGQLDSPRAGM